MFGSLVVVMPAVHKGGALIFRHAGEEWSFDAGMASIDCENLKASYIAFYSDVEHEVAVVTSGYRVTLTYNLCYASASGDKYPPSSVNYSVPYEFAFKEALSTLLADRTFLPKGGHLAFGLSHQYPITAAANMNRDRKCATPDLDSLRGTLKGSDAVISRVCRELGIDASIYVAYNVTDGQILCGRIVNFGDYEIESVGEEMVQKWGGKWISNDWDDVEEKDRLHNVLWVTKMEALNTVGSSALIYGNEASLEYVYGHICFVIHVDEAKERSSQVTQ